jgi:hypothetical protein
MAFLNSNIVVCDTLQGAAHDFVLFNPSANLKNNLGIFRN